MMLARIEEQTGKPLRAMIEVSDRCNEVCLHCYQVQGQKGEMSTEQLKSVLDELARMGVLILTISGGEATLRHDFIELLEHMRKLGFAVRLFTNGLTMTRELALEMKRLAVHVVEISLYSHRAEVHDVVTGVKGSFERTVAGIRHLAELGVDVHVKTPLMRINEDDRDAYIDFVKDLGATFAFDHTQLLPREDGDRETERLARSQHCYEEVSLADQAERPIFQPGELPPRGTGSGLEAMLCGAGDSVHLEPNGELRPCTMLQVSLGHARDGIAHARETNEVLHAMRALSWRDAHGCRSCALAGDCGRCHAAALAEVGDALAPYPSACANARSNYRVRTGHVARIDATPGRAASLGPYAASPARGAHCFETIEDVVTPDDEALAVRLGWVRREGGPAAAPGPAVSPGQLVQLRRPGARKARALQLPARSPVVSGEGSADSLAAPSR
jgi:radical SAM protein with 4Fe4S-binding SPASM domain